jgi:hypothetical protein
MGSFLLRIKIKESKAINTGKIITEAIKELI